MYSYWFTTLSLKKKKGGVNICPHFEIASFEYIFIQVYFKVNFMKHLGTDKIWTNEQLHLKDITLHNFLGILIKITHHLIPLVKEDIIPVFHVSPF